MPTGSNATAEPPADIVKFAEGVRAREDVVVRSGT